MAPHTYYGAPYVLWRPIRTMAPHTYYGLWQDTDEASLDECRSVMPWPSLALGSGLPAYLGQRYGVSSIPSLVLLSRAGDLISIDGVRLLRRHARAFPWTAMSPPQTPHLHPLCERLLRLGPVDPGQSHDLPKCMPLVVVVVEVVVVVVVVDPRAGLVCYSTVKEPCAPSPWTDTPLDLLQQP
jgi:hypothetical protein